MKNIINLKNTILLLVFLLVAVGTTMASSHREAPLISNDPLADNVDLYAFRSPDNPEMITIIATYVPLQLPHGGPNYHTFGENIRYEIHVDNDANVIGDEITYRFTFNIVNEDPSTFFNMRLGAQNQKATYTLERSIDGGESFQMIIENGIVPPNNVGPRSIESGVGLGTTYNALFQNAITQANTGETVFAGPTDDPFFVDLGGIFDLGDAPRQNGTPTDGLACYNVSALAIQVPISTLLKANVASSPANILDGDYVIGVWASASRPAITTLSSNNNPTYSGDWIQVSRLGMPLTNEAVIPIGQKDRWNTLTPYNEDASHFEFFYNPELALYMDDDLFGGAVPAFGPLRIQKASLGAFDFTNGADGLYGLKGSDAVAGTALDDAIFGTLLLPDAGKPRSADLWPIFHTGVPNFPPYQLATGKEGNPLAAGKPFINNFLPNGGDMLRLNMATPVTPRDDPNFSSLGLVQAAAIGLTVAPFNETADLEFIPNMDGFPNGRRLEDDVTRIELQAVGGVVLAAIGLWYDDYDPATSPSPVTTGLLNVLTYSTGVESNDRAFTNSFPYLAMPNSGTGECSGEIIEDDVDCMLGSGANVSMMMSSPNANDACVFALAFDGLAPFTYHWNNGATTEEVCGLGLGEYCVTVTDMNECTATDCVVLSNTPKPLGVGAATENDCADVLYWGGVAPFTFLWSNGATTELICGLPDGQYCVTVTDANESTNSDCVFVNTAGIIFPLGVGTGAQDPSTPGGNDGCAAALVWNGTPPFTYLWDNGETTAKICNLSEGIYCVTVTDANGMTNSDCETLFDPTTAFISNGNGNTIANSKSNTDAFLRQAEIQLLDNDIHVYPNPTKDFATIAFQNANARASQIEVFNATGQKVLSLDEAKSDLIQLDLTGFNTGLYLIRLKINDIYLTKRLLLIK